MNKQHNKAKHAEVKTPFLSRQWVRRCEKNCLPQAAKQQDESQAVLPAAPRGGCSLWILLDEPGFTRVATGDPIAARPCNPRAAKTVETPAATLSRVLD